MRKHAHAAPPEPLRGPRSPCSRSSAPARSTAAWIEDVHQAQARQGEGRPTSTRCSRRSSSETYGVIVYQEQVMQIAQVARRLLARRRRQPPPRDGQEEEGGDGQGARALPSRAPSSRASPADARDDASSTRWRRSRPTASTSRHSRRVRADLVPDRVPEGALPARVHGRRCSRSRWATPTRPTRTSPSAARTASRSCRPTSTRAGERLHRHRRRASASASAP